MLEWLKNILTRLKLFKSDKSAEVPRINVRDVDFEKINRRSELLRKLTDEQQLAVKKTPEDLVTCPTCGEHVDKTVKCVKCGKEICENCGIHCSASISLEGAETAPEGYYCEDCW